MSDQQSSNFDQMAQDFLTVSDTYTGTQSAPDPFPMYEELRQNTPVIEGDILAKYNVPSQADYAMSGRPVMSVFRYKDVAGILQDPENWQSFINADGFGAAVDNLLLTAMDGEAHKKFRQLLQPPFILPAMRKISDAKIRPMIKRDFIDKLRPQGKADLVRELSYSTIHLL